MTKICPNCQHENPVIAPVCSNCKTLLPEVPTEIVDIEEVSPVLKQRGQAASRHIDSAGNTLTLLIPPEQSPLTKQYRDGDQLILGRTATETPEPTIDLSPFGAVSLGVSRQHAVITFSDGACSVVDLGSSNGTWLNENRLEPHTVQPLRNGDMLRLGNMLVFAYFSSRPVSSVTMILGEKTQRFMPDAGYRLTPQYLAEKVTPFVNSIFAIQSELYSLLEIKTTGPEVVSIGLWEKQPGIEVRLRGAGEAVKFLHENIYATGIQKQSGREVPVTTVITEEDAPPKEASGEASASVAEPMLPPGWAALCGEFLAKIAPGVSDETRVRCQQKILPHLTQLAGSGFEITSVEQ